MRLLCKVSQWSHTGLDATGFFWLIVPEQRIEFQPFCRHTHNTVVKKVKKYILRNVTFLESVGGIETTFHILKKNEQHYRISTF